MQIIPVILSGGSGTRLWPLSRKQYPKQYLPLAGDNTMLQETILRLSGLGKLADPIIICNADHRFLVAEQCQQIDIENPVILLEPVGRNTAPAIAAAALQSIKQTDDAVLLVLSADHVIQNIDAFHQAINIASQQAQKGKLATFGIVPTDANTGYGYINVGTGVDVTIREMAEIMKEVVGFKGRLTFDATKPDGAPRKLINITRLSNMGWKYSTDLEDGLDITYKWYLNRG